MYIMYLLNVCSNACESLKNILWNFKKWFSIEQTCKWLFSKWCKKWGTISKYGICHTHLPVHYYISILFLRLLFRFGNNEFRAYSFDNTSPNFQVLLSDFHRSCFIHLVVSYIVRIIFCFLLRMRYGILKILQNISV